MTRESMIPDDARTIAALRTAMAAQVRGHHLDPDRRDAVLDRLDARPRHRHVAGGRNSSPSPPASRSSSRWPSATP